MFSSIFMSVALAQSFNCDLGQVRQVFVNASVEKTRYCFNSSKDAFISENCKFGKCAALNGIISKIKPAVVSTYGKPGSKLCGQLGGEFQIVQFLADSKWWKLDRCVFSGDESFVDTDTLMLNYSE